MAEKPSLPFKFQPRTSKVPPALDSIQVLEPTAAPAPAAAPGGRRKSDIPAGFTRKGMVIRENYDHQLTMMAAEQKRPKRDVLDEILGKALNP